MPKIIDARGKACPEPVLLSKKAMAGATDVLTIVDGPDQAENVAAMGRKAGWSVQVDGKEDGVYIRMVQPGGGAMSEPRTGNITFEKPAAGPLVLAVSSEVMGRGEHAELGMVLIRSFFHTLLEVQPRPETIIFFNSGVKLVAEGSPILEDLRTLGGQGIKVLACGTCLGYYNLKEKVAVGEVSNMYTIAETMLGAGKVVTI